MSSPQAFADALLAVEPACPPGLTTWNGSAPAPRFAVYRNNVVVSLIDALADSFPVTLELVGEEFFRAMARRFVHLSPPCSPVLALYGEGFADFIEAFPAAAGVPYLGAVARLEMLRILAWHAADATALTMEQLDRLLTDVETLPQARFTLHPSLRVLDSRYAVVSLWLAHQAESAAQVLADVNPARGETALVWRQGLDVEIIAIAPDAGVFITHLQQGRAFGAAAQLAQAAAAGFDLAATLAMLIGGGALVDVKLPESTPT